MLASDEPKETTVVTDTLRTPLEICRLNDGEALSIVWDDGETSVLTASRLRAGSRAAGEVRAVVDGQAPSSDPGVRLVGLELIGNYAARLSFSDGHDRGIYPWSYLHELAAQRS